jgi:hypothetical protein
MIGAGLTVAVTGTYVTLMRARERGAPSGVAVAIRW